MSMLGKLTELRDENTAGHNKRVTFYMVLFAEALGLSPEEVVRVAKSAFLHDIGKLVVPDRVLDKPGALTPEERVEMENHVLRGAEIVMESQLLSGAAPIVAAHHEHFDGSGYPKGLKGEDIPREARMFALVDVFDALTSPRVYKAALTIEESLNTMAGGRGSHFDPVLFDRFVELAPSFAKQLPKEEGALTTMLMRRLFPYLDCFLLGQSLIEHSKKKRIMTGPISRS
jgi:putative nucleotidyltransferase with HDIG domain